VLARTIEEQGIPTVTITMMPELASQMRLSRILGVEFPFGQAFGMIGDSAMQRKVAEAAVKMLVSAGKGETRQDLDIEWPIDTKTAYKGWQPSEASPIVAASLELIHKARREMKD